MGMVDNLEALLAKALAKGEDSALLRFSLGSACLKEDRAQEAVLHLARAVQQDPGYTAAWKLYGKALAQTGKASEAMHAYEQGIRAADARRDVQAGKEMRVFLKRLQKQAAPSNGTDPGEPPGS